jgi:hypothetical protein
MVSWLWLPVAAFVGATAGIVAMAIIRVNWLEREEDG